MEGQGTWRSFRATLNCLKPFVKKDLMVNFVVSDEYDGFKAKESLNINLAKGLPNPS